MNTTANQETKITTVVIYKDAKTAKEVENAARNTRIWESRATPGLEGQTEYFRPPRDIIRRATNQDFVPNDLEEDQQGKTLQGESLPGSPIQITETQQIITIEDDSSSVEITEVIEEVVITSPRPRYEPPLTKPPPNEHTQNTPSPKNSPPSAPSPNNPSPKKSTTSPRVEAAENVTTMDPECQSTTPKIDATARKIENETMTAIDNAEHLPT